MDIEQSLIRNESFNDNEIRFFSETDEVVDESTAYMIKINIKIKMLMAAPTNLLLMQTMTMTIKCRKTVLMNFLHWRNLKRAYSVKTMTIKCRQTVRHSRFRRQRQHLHSLGIWIWNFLVSQ